MNIAGNWHLDALSTDLGTPTVAIDGAISQSGTSLSGEVHVDGSNCLDRLTTVGLTGTVSGNNVSLTSTSTAGQFTTLSGSSNGNSFAGTYTIRAAVPNRARVTGRRILPISNAFTGTFTASGGESFDVGGNVAQDNRAGSEGSFGLSGTVSFRTSCFSSGTFKSGTFPSGSFIIGTSTALEIETGNGTVTFLGRLNPATGKTAGTTGLRRHMRSDRYCSAVCCKPLGLLTRRAWEKFSKENPGETLGVHFCGYRDFFCSAGAGDTKGEGDTTRITRGRGASSPPPSLRPECGGQLAIQHNINGWDARRNDCWWDQSIRQFGKWRGACRGFEVF